jgi:chaperonin cofactor prefoldin
MPHLYELTEQFRGLQEFIESGEMSLEDLQDTLEGLTGDVQAKGASTMLVMANLKRRAEAYDAEVKRMQAISKSLDGSYEWLKNYLRDNMAACGITKIESPLFTATLGKPGLVVEILDEAKIPELHKELIPASWRIDKKSILRDLKAGIDVPGAHTVPGKAPLTIR